MCDTPVRHDDISITKSSLRSKVLICVQNKKNIKRKEMKNNLSTKRNHIITECSMLNGMNKSSSIYLDRKKDEKPVTLGVELSVKLETDEKETKLVTHCGDTEQFSMNQIGMEEKEGQKQKHSTPRVVSKLANRTVSSTPNQDVFNNSRLIRNVYTQTTFTLTSRDLVEYNSDLKSCFTELPDYSSEVEISPSKKNYFDVNSSNSPFRSVYGSKHFMGEITPNHNKQSLRKLSLRSKTMICSFFEKTKDLPNSFMKCNSEDEKRVFSSSYSVLPHPKTPPSCAEKVVHNPFEVDCPEMFGKSFFSPNVFDTVVSPSEDSEYLRWTIEDVSSINPVPIEEDFSPPPENDDPEKESMFQQEIDRYFSETHLILSPDDINNLTNHKETKVAKFLGGATASTPQYKSIRITKELRDASTQTILTLPENLPQDLDESVRSLFKVFEIDELNLSSSNLRRKLFFHSEDEPPSPVRFETFSSPVNKTSTNWEQSPCLLTKNGRYFTPVACQEEFSSPEMSPVVPKCINTKPKPSSSFTCKKTLHLYFSGPVGDEEVNGHFSLGSAVNSTAIMNSASGQCDMSLNCSSVASSTLPASQDTGYHTEESFRQQLITSPNKPLHFSMLSLTPNHRN